MKYLCILILFAAPFISSAQIITTIAGTGAWTCSGDGGAATSATVGQLDGVATDTSGNIYLSCFTCSKIRKIDRHGVISNVAGNGSIYSSGDGGQATNAGIGNPWGIAIDKNGNLLICDNGNSVIRKVTPTGIISTIAGDAGTVGGGYTGDGGPASRALIKGPAGITTDTAGNIYFSDRDNSVIRKISTTGIISRLAGTAYPGFSGDGGSALAAMVEWPEDVAIDKYGNLLIADNTNRRIRKVTPSGIISTIAGNGTVGFSGDNGPATAATLTNPSRVCVDRKGNILVSDENANRIRKIDTNGTITTFAGNGTVGDGGDGGPAIRAQLNSVEGIATDQNNCVYIAELNGARVRRLDTCMVPAIAPISGASIVCVGGRITLGNTAHGGTWHITDTSIAGIDSTGLVRGISRGIDTVTYTMSNGCATLNEYHQVIVGPFAGVISGSNVFRHGATGIDTFCYSAWLSTTGAPGGVWGLTNTSIATLTGSGNFRPLIWGVADTAFYAVHDTCGDDTAFFPFVIVWCPDAAINVLSQSEEVELYPVPAIGELVISSSGIIHHVSVADLTGRVLHESLQSGNKVVLDISGFAPGIYLLRINDSILRKFEKD